MLGDLGWWGWENWRITSGKLGVGLGLLGGSAGESRGQNWDRVTGKYRGRGTGGTGWEDWGCWRIWAGKLRVLEKDGLGELGW